MAAALPPVYVVSGGTGASGTQLVHTVLAQFPEPHPEVRIVAHVRTREQLQEVTRRAIQERATVVHTLVADDMRAHMRALAHRYHVVEIDLVGDVMGRLRGLLQREPLGKPGLYRRRRQEYLERIEAIEYTVEHDDGRNPETWNAADAVLVGPSRSGKTPLSMYLAVRGWNVANVPLVLDLPVPAGLLSLDRKRVVALNIEASELAEHRRFREQRLGLQRNLGYSNIDEIDRELEAARRLHRTAGFAVVDVTQKPIEETAEEVAALVGGRLEASDSGEG